MNKHLLRGKFIKNYFAETPALSIKSSDYQAFINKYAETNCRDNVSRLNAEIKNVILFSKRDKLNIDDFTEGIVLSGRPPKKKKDEKYIHSMKDYQKLVNYLQNILDLSVSVIPHILYIQLKTGLRAGEVSELTWNCILWESSEIKTYRRYDTVRYRWTKAKTEDSIRNIPIDVDTLLMFQRIKQEQEQVEIYNPDEMLFVNVLFGVPSNNACNKQLQTILESLEIEPNTMTCTGNRHTYASILLSEDIDIWVIAKNMGHKDIKKVTETYGHLIKEKAELENNKVRQVLYGLLMV